MAAVFINNGYEEKLKNKITGNTAGT